MQTLEADEDANFAMLGPMDAASLQFVEEVVIHREPVEYKLTRKLKILKSRSLWLQQYFHREDTGGVENGWHEW